MINDFLVPAFLAGIFMFLAPCTFPLVPAFLGAISGITPEGLRDSGAARWRLVRNAALFVAGFSLVFIIFGTAVGWGGQFLFPYRRILERIAGVFIILFGLALLGAFPLPFCRAATNLRVRIPGVNSRSLQSFLLGAAFGTGWTPCVGPVLGSVLLLASTSGTAASGAALLAVFSVGLAIPFLLVAFAAGRAVKILDRLGRSARLIEIVSGGFLVALGLLVFFQRFAVLISLGYGLFDFIGYERLLEKL